jgi:hypothetical protein
MKADINAWFPKAVELCEKELQRHIPAKGDSWKRMSIGELVELCDTAAQSIVDLGTFGEEYEDQLVDVINLALMVLQRLAEEDAEQ